MARKVRLYSPLKPIPLARILEEDMDRDWTELEKDHGRVGGRGTEKKIFLKVQHWGQRDDSAYSLEGTMREERGGTIIEGSLGRGKKAKFFVYGWFGFLSFFIVVSMGMMLVIGATLDLFAISIGVPLLMMAIGGFLFGLSARRGPKEVKRILKFLTDKVDAMPVQKDK